MNDRNESIVLEAVDITKHFSVGGLFSQRKHPVQALTGVSVAVRAGETVAVVGESGCGKSTLGRCLMYLIEPTSGVVRLRGQEVTGLLASEPLKFRRAIQIVFQDPYASLNPRRTIGQCLDDPLRVHRYGEASQRQERAKELLRQVGLSTEYLNRFPHELSGGQRQRVALARALAPGPDLIVCDEAVSALDVSVQAQIINLLKDIQASIGVAYLFITHNLELVRRIADRIVVMYLGQIVESGDTATLRKGFLHPYSKALFAASPKLRRGTPDVGSATLVERVISGEVPSPIDPPSGCRFHTRCSHRQAICTELLPEFIPVAGHLVRCHLFGQLRVA